MSLCVTLLGFKMHNNSMDTYEFTITEIKDNITEEKGMRELEDVLQSPIDKFSDHHHQMHALRLKTVMEAAKLLKFPEGVAVEDLRAAMNIVKSQSDGLRRWARLMDAREETKIRTYFGLATISMAIIAISYCGNLPMPRIQTSFSEIFPAPGAASPYSSDTIATDSALIFENRKRMFRPFLLGAMSLTLCLFGIINSRRRTYTFPVVLLELCPARVSCDDPLVQVIVLFTCYTLMILSFFDNFLQVEIEKVVEALNHTGARVYVVALVLLFLLSIFMPFGAIGVFGLFARYARKLKARIPLDSGNAHHVQPGHIDCQQQSHVLC